MFTGITCKRNPTISGSLTYGGSADCVLAMPLTESHDHPDVYEPPNLFVNGGEIRTLEYCKEECLSLSKQLNFFKEFMEDPKNGFCELVANWWKERR